MTRVLTALAAIALGSVVETRADNSPETNAILDKAIKAVGGDLLTGKFKAARWKVKGMVHGAIPGRRPDAIGSGSVPFEGEVAAQFPDQFRLSTDSTVNGIKFGISTGLNHDKGWMLFSNGTRVPLDKKRLAAQKEDLYAEWVTTVVLLKDKSYTLTPLGESKIEGHRVTGIKVASQGHRDINLYFDTDSGLLLKRERQVADPRTGKEQKQESFYSDYKEFEGIKFPMKVTTKQDGALQREESRFDFKPLEKLDDQVFAEP